VNKDSAEDFDSLLSWLDPDRERAGEKYETIRQRLIKIFTWNRASDPEGLADETIIRVARKVRDIEEVYEGDPSLYFYGVARNLLHESRRLPRPQREPRPDDVVLEIKADDGREQLYDCLDQCISKLSSANRELLLSYYEGSKQGTVRARQKLAVQFGLQPSALRMRVLRIRTALEKCIEECMEVTSV
jgi:DNA-directed RNA polymerase specialized sigma24 family protein